MECLRTGLPRELVPRPEISVKMEKVNRAFRSSRYTLPSLAPCPPPPQRHGLDSSDFTQQYLAVGLKGKGQAAWSLLLRCLVLWEVCREKPHLPDASCVFKCKVICSF